MHCPFLKKGKAKAFKATTWDKTDSEEEEEHHEVANFYLMAKDNEVLSSPTITLKFLSNEEEDDETLHDEYKELYKELCNDHALVLKKIKSLQKKLHESESHVLELNSDVHKLLDENEKLMLEIKDNDQFEKNEKTLRVQNESLTKENERLKKALSSFSKGQKSFDILIGSQRMMFDRKGFGFERMQNIKQKYSKNNFVKAFTSHTYTSTPPSSSTHNTCTYC